MTKAELVSITGSPQVNGWPYVFSNQEKDLVCSIAITGKNAKNIGHEIVEIIDATQLKNINQLHNLSLDILSKLRELEAQPQLAILWLPQQSSSSSATSLESSSEDSQKLSNTSDNQHINSHSQMVLAVYKAKVILKRNSKIGVVIKSEQNIQLIQGSVKDGDELILMTQQSNQIEQSLRQLFKQAIPHDEIKTQLRKKVEMLIDSSLTAIALTRLKNEPVKASGSKPFLFKTNSKKAADNPNPNQTIIKDNKEKFNLEENISDNIKNTNLNAEETPREKQDKLEKPDVKIKISLKPIKKILKLIGKASKKGALILSPIFKNLFNKIKTKIIKKNSAKQNSSKIDNFNISNESEKLFQKTNTTSDDKKNLDTIFESSKKKLNLPQTSTEEKDKKTLNLASLLRFPFKKTVYLERKTSKKFFRFLSILLLIMLLIGGGALYIRKIYQDQQQQAQEALVPAQTLLLEANNIMNQDIVLARDKTAEAITIITQQQKELASNKFTQKYFAEELQKARDFFTEISGMIEVSQLDIFFDLREQAPNFITSEVATNNSTMFFLDREQKQIAILDIQTKKLNLIKLPDLTAKDITASTDQLYLLGNGIYNLSLEPLNFEGFEELKSEGDSDREAILIKFFESYLYVLNPEKRNIYRYIVDSDDLSEPIGWLTDKQGIQFDQINSMVVDGFIWLADDNGKIFKLEKGIPIEFNISGLEEEFGSSIKLYADNNTQYLYVLEPEKQRLVLLSTEGDFIKQITHPSLASATQIIINEQLGLGFAVSGSIVYAVPIR